MRWTDERRETMRSRDHHRGNPIVEGDDGRWRYEDGVLVEDDRDRACGACGLPNTEEGYDGCIGEIPSAVNACCGHGDPSDAYVQYEDRCLRGEDAFDHMPGIGYGIVSMIGERRFWVVIHNLIAHPLLVTGTGWAERFHDWTAERAWPMSPRGRS